MARNSATAENKGGQKFLPFNPLSFGPPELKSFSKFSVRIFAKKSDFVQGGGGANSILVFRIDIYRLKLAKKESPAYVNFFVFVEKSIK